MRSEVGFVLLNAQVFSEKCGPGHEAQVGGPGFRKDAADLLLLQRLAVEDSTEFRGRASAAQCDLAPDFELTTFAGQSHRCSGRSMTITYHCWVIGHWSRRKRPPDGFEE
jgi:hypothetical protein